MRASPDVLGQTISLDDRAHVIVGVMPPDFYFPSRNRDFWRTLRLGITASDSDRGNNYLAVIGRLKDGVSIEDARAEMDLIGAQLAQAYPKALEGKGVTLAPWREQITGQPRVLLLGLVGASICVLLIACTNLANLLMSRALARRSEFAVRAAIGASVDRLVRQMLTDSFVLAACGGVLGIVLAIVAAPLLVRLVPTSLPIAEVPPTDLRMLAGTLLLTIGAGMAFGLLPALRVCRKTDGAALKDGARGGTSRGTERLRSSLVVAEIVASVVLIVTVGLLTQALLNVQRVDPGFKADNVLTVRTTLPRTKYPKAAQREQFYQRVLNDVKALPGVQSAAYISFLPMVMGGGVWPVLSTVPDPGELATGSCRRIRRTSVAPACASSPLASSARMRTPILRGRDVSADDTPNTTHVAVVSESLVRQYFPDRDPLGQQFAFAFKVRTIVGVVGDIRVRGLEADTSEPQVYLPAGQFTDGDPLFYVPQDLAIRASVPVTTLVPAVRAIIAAADPLLPIINVRTLEDIVSLETASRVVQLRVLGAFAAVAFLLAAIGIHGLLAFTVSARSREIGVRIALGAKARDIIGMVIGRSADDGRARRRHRRRARLRRWPVDAGAAVRRRSRESDGVRRRHRARAAHDARRQPAARLARRARRSHGRHADGIGIRIPDPPIPCILTVMRFYVIITWSCVMALGGVAAAQDHLASARHHRGTRARSGVRLVHRRHHLARRRERRCSRPRRRTARVAMVNFALTLARTFVETDDFKRRYADHREANGPDPLPEEPSVDAILAKQRAGFEEQVEQMRKLFDQITPEQRATLEAGWKDMRQQLADMETGPRRAELDEALSEQRVAQVREREVAMKAARRGVARRCPRPRRQPAPPLPRGLERRRLRCQADR